MASPGRCSSLWSVTRFLAGIVPSKPSTQHSQPTLVTEAGGQRRCLGQGGGLSPRLCLQDLCIYGRVCVYTSAVGGSGASYLWLSAPVSVSTPQNTTKTEHLTLLIICLIFFQAA